jgi:hypothetical protein
MQAPVEANEFAPLATPAPVLRTTKYRGITALYTLLAAFTSLLTHAFAPALIVAIWQDVRNASPGVALAWALFLGSFLLAIMVIILSAFLAARAASERTGRRGAGLGAAAIVATCGVLALAFGGVGTVLTQASPLTAVNSPPLGVAALAYHEGLAGGLALFYCAVYLPLLLMASVAGLLGAARGASMFLRARAGAPTVALPPRVQRVA